MNNLVQFMKQLYILSETKEYDWKPVYLNNFVSNGIVGIYFDINLKTGENKYCYLKYTIQYQWRCDENGISHPYEGTDLYILHEYRKDDLSIPIVIPDPSDDKKSYSDVVNRFGRFRYAFHDEKTAKSVISNELKHIIYPYLYILNDTEKDEWYKFLQERRH